MCSIFDTFNSSNDVIFKHTPMRAHTYIKYILVVDGDTCFVSSDKSACEIYNYGIVYKDIK